MTSTQSVDLAHNDVSDYMLLCRIMGFAKLSDLSLALLCRIYRARKNIKLEAAAKEIGITRQLLAEIEDTNKIPQDAKIKLLCNYYGENFTMGVRILALYPKD